MSRIPSFSGPFKSLESRNYWEHIEVSVSITKAHGYFNISQNGPFFFFSPVDNPRNIDFLVFTVNFLPMKEILRGHEYLKLQNNYISDFYICLAIEDEEIQEEFISQFMAGTGLMSTLFEKLPISECTLPFQTLYSFLPNTKTLLETRLLIVNDFKNGMVLNTQVKTLKGWEKKLDIILGPNCIVEPALRVPEGFSLSAQYQLIFHVQDITPKGQEGFYLCTSIEQVMTFILSITKWSFYAYDLHKSGRSHSNQNITPTTPTLLKTSINTFDKQKTKTKEKPAPAKSSPFMDKITSLLKTDKKQPEKENPEKSQKQEFRILKVNPPTPPPLIPTIQSQPIEISPLTSNNSNEFKQEDNNNENSTEQNNEEISTESTNNEENSTEQDKTEEIEPPPAPKPPPKIVLTIKKEISSGIPLSHLEQYTSKGKIIKAVQNKQQPKEDQEQSPSVSKQSSQSQIQYGSLRGRKFSLTSMQLDSIKPPQDPDDDKSKEEPKRKVHVFPNPRPLEDQLRDMKNKQEKRKVSTYKVPATKQYLANVVFDDKYKENIKNEIFESLSTEINFDDFSNFSEFVPQTYEQMISNEDVTNGSGNPEETEETIKFINDSINTFSFIDFESICPSYQNKEKLIHPEECEEYKKSEIEIHFEEIKEKMLSQDDTIIYKDTSAISKFIFLITCIFINGLRKNSLDPKRNFVSIYKTLSEDYENINTHLEASEQQKKLYNQVSVFVQSLILSQDLVPFLYFLMFQYDFISSNYSPYSILASGDLLNKLIHIIDKIMLEKNFEFIIKPEIPDEHKDLFISLYKLQPFIEHELDEVYAKDPSSSTFLKDLIRVTDKIIKAGNVKQKPWSFILDVPKKCKNISGDDWKVFCTFARSPYGANIYQLSQKLDTFLESAIKRRKLHIWFIFLVISSQDLLNEYYCEDAPIRNLRRANYTIAMLFKIMHKMGPPSKEESSSSGK